MVLISSAEPQCCHSHRPRIGSVSISPSEDRHERQPANPIWLCQCGPCRRPSARAAQHLLAAGPVPCPHRARRLDRCRHRALQPDEPGHERADLLRRRLRPDVRHREDQRQRHGRCRPAGLHLFHGPDAVPADRLRVGLQERHDAGDDGLRRHGCGLLHDGQPRHRHQARPVLAGQVPGGRRGDPDGGQHRQHLPAVLGPDADGAGDVAGHLFGLHALRHQARGGWRRNQLHLRDAGHLPGHLQRVPEPAVPARHLRRRARIIPSRPRRPARRT
mmetsp:Transcript_53303/g.125260  ORF Transcript_53303/g.125260 Transcript_53303/m.125260 type:complete len:274 (-) Transcript_53303:4280-5101(-)